MEKQVDKSHYTFARYCWPERWASYYYQIREVLAKKPQTLLEIGGGEEVLKHYVSRQGVAYTSLDIADDLKPDIQASVTDMPLEDDSYDMVVAFEVLEHLPFDQFEKALLEMRRVAKEYVILSVPHFGPPVTISFKIPFIKEIRLAFKVPFPKEHEFNGQHYWEVGKKGYSPRRIRTILKQHFTLEKEFVPFDSQYHHFYILKK